MRGCIATVDARGRITVPDAIRRHLGLAPSSKVTFVVGADGQVQIQPARYTLETVLGSLPALPNESADLDREITEAQERALADRHRGQRPGPLEDIGI
jgi:AbrB family looped-hinge helix DNA binding protein